MEKMMHYIWQHRLWQPSAMTTVDGRRLRIIDQGRLNSDAGPDFFNAKVSIDGQLWVGDVEMHVKATDWYRHGHHTDPAYNSVVLHVVDKDDGEVRRTVDDSVIPQVCLRYSPRLVDVYNRLQNPLGQEPPCIGELVKLQRVVVADWLNSLALERINAKVERIDSLLGRTVNNWEEVGFITLARAMGTGTNGDAFQRLALSCPLRLMAKHADSDIALESLLFGQAGMLDEPSDNYYHSILRREYDFFRNKFGLTPPPDLNWKMARMRPANFPHRRIALLAAFLAGGFRLTRSLLEAADVEEARACLTKDYSAFWESHFSFSSRESAPQKRLSAATVDSLVINVAVPLIYAYGLHHPSAREGEAYQDKALRFLEQLPPEKNFITSMFAKVGIKCRDAFSSQALIQLKTGYCDAKKCIYCRFGHKMLSRHVVVAHA